MPFVHNYKRIFNLPNQGILKGKYHCTVDLLFDWFGLVCIANKNKNCQLSYRWFQTSQTGRQWHSDTSPSSIPRPNHSLSFFNSRAGWVGLLGFNPVVQHSLLPLPNFAAFPSLKPFLGEGKITSSLSASFCRWQPAQTSGKWGCYKLS